MSRVGQPLVASLYLPPWRIDITRRPGVSLPLSAAALARATAAALAHGQAPSPASVGLILADDHELAVLNAEHMAEEGPTDVLSFPLLQPRSFPRHAGQDPTLHQAVPSNPEPAFSLPPRERLHLGDVVVSVERAAAQAHEGRGGQTKDVGWSAAHELRLLVVHGVLHICGWDHARPDERDAMRALESAILNGLSSRRAS